MSSPRRASRRSLNSSGPPPTETPSRAASCSVNRGNPSRAGVDGERFGRRRVAPEEHGELVARLALVQGRQRQRGHGHQAANAVDHSTLGRAAVRVIEAHRSQQTNQSARPGAPPGRGSRCRTSAGPRARWTYPPVRERHEHGSHGDGEVRHRALRVSLDRVLRQLREEPSQCPADPRRAFGHGVLQPTVRRRTRAPSAVRPPQA